jgi:ABC-type sugar transport system substrate-binding protein
MSPLRSKVLVLVAVVTALGLVAAGCGSSSGSSSSSTAESTEAASSGTESGGAEKTTAATETEGEGKTTAGPGGGIEGQSVYIVAPAEGNPWVAANVETVKKGLEAEGASVTTLSDPFNPQVESENLNRAIAAKPGMIAINPLVEEAMIPGLTRAKAAGIPVVNMSSPWPAAEAAGLLTASMEADHEELGQFAAENIIEGLKGQGTDEGNVIAITGNKGLTQVEARMEAFEKTLAEKAPKLKLVAVEDGNWDQTTSQKIARQLFAQYQSNGGIQAAYGMADNQAVGIIQAAKEAGLGVGGKKGLIVTGSNCYQAGLEAIENGEEFGTATQSPFQEGEFEVGLMTKWWNGEAIPVRSLAPEERVTSKNVKKISAENICP